MIRARSRGRETEADIAIGVLCLALVVLAVWLTAGYKVGRSGTDVAALVLFFSLLPLVNALADFASCGLTRFLMRRGANGQPFWRGVADSLAGLGIFVLLGCTTIALVHWVRPQNGVALADLTAVFDGIGNRETRGDYGWLLFMLGTTLLPTVLHFAVGMAAFFTLYPACLRSWIVTKLEEGAEGHSNAGKQGQAALALAMTLAVLLPCGLVWQAFTLRYGLLDGLIWGFRGFAEMIGAIPGGPPI